MQPAWRLTLYLTHPPPTHLPALQEQPLPPAEVEVDEFQFNYSSQERPHIQNDSVTLPRRTAADHRTKLAISYALAQSTKLSIYEQRVVDIVSETKHLPEDLAVTGGPGGG
jgi:uncharacterized Rmd1/YagE family protein